MNFFHIEHFPHRLTKFHCLPPKLVNHQGVINQGSFLWTHIG